jgi:hypothetical protein
MSPQDVIRALTRKYPTRREANQIALNYGLDPIKTVIYTHTDGGWRIFSTTKKITAKLLAKHPDYNFPCLDAKQLAHL